MKKKHLVDYIDNWKQKEVVGNDIQSLYKQISKLPENVDHLVTGNGKVTTVEI